MQSLIRGIFRHAAKVVVLGTRDQKVLSPLLRLRPDQSVVLYNAVPDPRPALTRTQQQGDPRHVLFLGHLSERKGVPELIRALARPEVVSRHWRATLAGGGPIEEYRRLADELGIAQRIDFPGWVDQSKVTALCADADLVVLPSHAEGMAMAVLEGLSHGLPVIATPVGAHEEVIESDVSGILVPPGDVEALANALVHVIDDEGLRDRLGAGARRRYLEMFDVRGYAERLSHLHANLLAVRRGVEAVGNERTS